MTFKIHHKQGRHYATLRSLAALYFISLFYSRCKLHFTNESIYNLHGVDQYDWNKVVGRGGLNYKHGRRKTEQFLVWRYNRIKERFEITEYGRKNYEMYWDVARPNEGWVSLKFLKSTLPLGGYFGGNKTAPTDLIYYIEV